MTKRDIFEKFDILSKDKLHAKNNKEVYAKNDAMTTVIKCCRGEKWGKRKIDAFRGKLMIPDSEITECPEYEVKSKIKNIFVNKKHSKNILLTFMKLILIFMSITEKKHKLMRIGVYIYIYII